MALSYAEIVDAVEALLQDSLNATFTTTEFDSLMPQCLTEVSRYVPREVKHLTSTVAKSKDITLNTADLSDLLWPIKAEWKTGQNPHQFRNVTRFGDTIRLEVDTAPTSAEDCYLYLAKVHRLQKEVGVTDLNCVLSGNHAKGALSLHVVSLGTAGQTVKKHTQVTVAGDTTATKYHVIADAAISGELTEAYLYITPALAEAANTLTGVTLALSDSTLTLPLEQALIKLLAARAVMSKGISTVNAVNRGGSQVWKQYQEWGKDALAEVLANLRNMATPRSNYLYPRS